MSTFASPILTRSRIHPEQWIHSPHTTFICKIPQKYNTVLDNIRQIRILLTSYTFALGNLDYGHFGTLKIEGLSYIILPALREFLKAAADVKLNKGFISIIGPL